MNKGVKMGEALHSFATESDSADGNRYTKAKVKLSRPLTDEEKLNMSMIVDSLKQFVVEKAPNVNDV